MIRAVLDANVFTSALIQPRGHSGQIIRLLFTESAFTLVASPDILAELRRVLAYPRIAKRITGTDEELTGYVHALALAADVVTPAIIPHVVQRDPDDDKYVATALEGRATYIVTGDKDLLELEQHEDIAILRPAAFLACLHNANMDKP